MRVQGLRLLYVKSTFLGVPAIRTEVVLDLYAVPFSMETTK